MDLDMSLQNYFSGLYKQKKSARDLVFLCLLEPVHSRRLLMKILITVAANADYMWPSMLTSSQNSCLERLH